MNFKNSGKTLFSISAADDSLIREVHTALQAAQRVSAVPVRVLDLLAAAPVLLRALESAERVLPMGLEYDQVCAALNLARGES